MCSILAIRESNYSLYHSGRDQMDKIVDKLDSLISDSSTFLTNVPVTFGKLRHFMICSFHSPSMELREGRLEGR